MSLGEMVVLVVGSLMLAIAGFRLAHNFFSKEARWERRRRRSNSPILARSNRPMVKLSVRAKKKRRK